MGWWHGDLNLGHLMSQGIRVSGDIYRMSAVEGYIGAPSTRSKVAKHVVAVYCRYATLRTRSIDVFQEIESISSVDQ